MPNPQISLEEAFSSTSSPPHLSTPRCQPQCDPKTTRSQPQVLQVSNFPKLSPPLRVKSTLPKATISCQFCSNKYKYRAGLYKHVKKYHSTQVQEDCGSIKCQEERCSFSCRYLSEIRSHLHAVHSIAMDMETLIFQTLAGTHECYIIYDLSRYTQ